MANNVVETQFIRDDDKYVTVKVTGVANQAWNAVGLLVQANSLFGANASQSFCPLTLTDIKFSMDVGSTGYVQFVWVSTVNVNTAIGTFGQIGSATFDGIAIPNNANTPSGDVGYTVNTLGAGNSFNFILTFAKDTQAILSNIAGINIAGNPAGWANVDSWF